MNMNPHINTLFYNLAANLLKGVQYYKSEYTIHQLKIKVKYTMYLSHLQENVDSGQCTTQFTQIDIVSVWCTERERNSLKINKASGTGFYYLYW